MRLPSTPLLLLSASLLLVGCNEQASTEKANAPATAESATPSASASAEAKPDLNDPNVLVIVNGNAIKADSFSLFNQQRLQMGGRGGNSPEEQMAVLDELVNFTLLRQDAEAQELEKQAEIAVMLDLLRTRVLAEAAVAEHMQKNEPSEESLKQLYEAQYGGQKSQEYKASHILLKTEEEAAAVISELEKGADFAELAKERSTGPSGPQGGDLGWFDQNQMVEPFAKAVVALESGSYTKTPVQTQFGWHVILREEHRDLDPPALDEVRQQLIQQKQQEILANYIAQLRETGNVQIQPPEATLTHPPMAPEK
jgi:peptidyl-prolyl cis-trans isomerase C